MLVLNLHPRTSAAGLELLGAVLRPLLVFAELTEFVRPPERIKVRCLISDTTTGVRLVANTSWG
jgi:hypothetical protein